MTTVTDRQCGISLSMDRGTRAVLSHHRCQSRRRFWLQQQHTTAVSAQSARPSRRVVKLDSVGQAGGMIDGALRKWAELGKKG